jgi:predicted Rossmann fold flavoprotein
MEDEIRDLIIVGGGAAGIFSALIAKENFPHISVLVLEKNNVLLSKVRISGGGRCNVTHACFDPYTLAQNYPRGHRELIGPFHQFQPRNTIEWFEARDVILKEEADGRMFPITDSSLTIIECLLREARKLGVEIRLQQKIERIEKCEEGFVLNFKDGQAKKTSKLLLATGNSKEGYQWAEHLGHTIQEPVPSLFTFNIPDFELKDLSGVSVSSAHVDLVGSPFEQRGPLLITHFGFSGPAILKLSAWGARFLFEAHYRASVKINWLPSHTEESIFHKMRSCKQEMPLKTLANLTLFPLPKNLWKALLGECGKEKLGALSDKLLRKLAHRLHGDLYEMEGKTTHKEEFVTCGGISLKEIDFKTMQSKKCSGLFFAGEILDIDGITGGFNFQNAWTTGYLAGKYLCC